MQWYQESTPVELSPGVKYKIPPSLTTEVTEVILDWKNKKFIKEIENYNSYHILSILAVRESNGKLCIRLDYRSINALVVGSRYDSPDFDRVRLFMTNREVITQLDLSEAYLHLRLSKDVQKFVRFEHLSKMYQFVRSPFGSKSMSGRQR